MIFILKLNILSTMMRTKPAQRITNKIMKLPVDERLSVLGDLRTVRSSIKRVIKRERASRMFKQYRRPRPVTPVASMEPVTLHGWSVSPTHEEAHEKRRYRDFIGWVDGEHVIMRHIIYYLPTDDQDDWFF